MMERTQKGLERAARTAAVATTLASLSGAALGAVEDPSPLQDLSFSRLDSTRFGDFRDLRRFDRGSFLSLIPGKTIDMSLGFGSRLSFSELKTSFRFGSERLMGGYEELYFTDRATIKQYSLQSVLPIGSNRLSFSGFRAGDNTSGLDKQSMQFGSNTLKVKAERLSVDSQFNRFADLSGLTVDEQKKALSEKGFERWDLNIAFNPAKGLSFTSDRFKADGKGEIDLSRSGFRDLASFNFGPGSSVSYLREGNSVSNSMMSLDETKHDLLSVSMNGKGLGLSYAHDTLSNSKPGVETDVRTDTFRLDGGGKIPVKAMFELKDTSVNAFHESSSLFDAEIRPGKNLMFHTKLFSVDRNQGESFKYSAIDWGWQLSPSMTFTGMTGRTSSDAGNSESFSVFNLQTNLKQGFLLKGMYETRNHETNGEKRVMDLGFQTTKPLNVKPIKNLNIAARLFESKVNGEENAKIVSADVSGEVAGAKFSLGHLESKDPCGTERKEDGIALSVGGGPKDKFGAGLQYKIRESSVEEPPRSIVGRLDYRPDSKSTLQVEYSLRPENDKRQALPTSKMSLSYTTQQGKFGYKALVGTGYDYNCDFRSTRFELGASGTFRDGSSLTASLGLLMEERAGEKRSFPLLGLSYDRKLSKDHFLTLQAGLDKDGWKLKAEGKIKF